MITQPRGIPLRPDFNALRDRSQRSLVRAAATHLLAQVGKTDTSAVLKRYWPGDRHTENFLSTKAARVPATETDATWAGVLAGSAVYDFISVLGPQSAGAQLLGLGLQLEFPAGVATISVPAMVAAISGAGFVGEGVPIPVQQGVVTKATLTRDKLACIMAFTHEITRHSAVNIEALVRASLTKSLGFALDSALLSSSAGDATRPPGLLHNITPLAASTATPPTEALLQDVSDLVGAVSIVAGNGPIVLVAAPKQAAALNLWSRGDVVYPVLASAALLPKTLVAIAANALVSAADPEPRFDIGSSATLHMDDTSPSDISISGTPAAVAFPVKGMFQTDSWALRMTTEVAWSLRHSAGAAFKENVTW